MARTGRPPKPTALKKLQGTLKKSRVNINEWKPPAGAPKMPAHFKGHAAREWRRVVPMLLDAGLLTLADAPTLEAYCETYARWKDAAAIVDAEGLVVEAKQGPVPHPAVNIEKAARKDCMEFAQRFGFDPSSRSKLAAPKKESKDQTQDFLFTGLQVVK